jgi:Putative Flp pilus-assembly TadE/G-like
MPLHVRAYPRYRQRGQALVYGLFALVACLAAMLFLFNVGQLVREKTHLVTAADAAAYSAGVMNARALNFMAYTNRALVANEVTVAQMVSLSSWAKYLQQHALSAGFQMNCGAPQAAVPVLSGMKDYARLCMQLAYLNQLGAVDVAGEAVQGAAAGVMKAAEAAKLGLQLSSVAVFGGLAGARRQVMQEVLAANFRDEGPVEADAAPLQDDFPTAVRPYGRDGDERARMAEVARTAVGRDTFTPRRAWSDQGKIPTCLDFSGPHYDTAVRQGQTQLVNYDEWRAQDAAVYNKQFLDTPKFRPPRCKTRPSLLGAGEQVASGDAPDVATPTGTQDEAGADSPWSGGLALASSASSASTGDWVYSGIPSFFELAPDALQARDVRLRFAVRVKRAAAALRTTDGASPIKASGRLGVYDARPAGGIFASVSASEVFFARPTPRGDGQAELGSLFNPYWQVRLAKASEEAMQAAKAMQGAAR